MRQSNLQLQNEAALMSCWIRAVEHRKCAAGLALTIKKPTGTFNQDSKNHYQSAFIRPWRRIYNRVTQFENSW